MAYININLDKELSLENTASIFDYSGRTLNRLFSSMMRTSFLQYLKLARIAHAMELLLQTDETISEIAYGVGYSSVSSFSNVFKGIKGKRPSVFLKHKKESF